MKQPKCVKCGRIESNYCHVHYGNDIDNPCKHEFEHPPISAEWQKTVRNDYKNVCQELSAYLKRPFKSHATDAVLILLVDIDDLKAELRELKAEKLAMFRVFRGFTLYCQECRVKCIVKSCPLLKAKVKK